LQGGDEPVDAERENAGADPEQAAVFPNALPDQPGAADLRQRGEDEQDDRAGNGHGPEPMPAP
jgi:hypothetical protein